MTIEMSSQASGAISAIANIFMVIAAFGQIIVAIVIALRLNSFNKSLNATQQDFTKAISTAEHRRELRNAWQQYNLAVLNNPDIRKYLEDHDSTYKSGGITDIIGCFIVFLRINFTHEAW